MRIKIVVNQEHIDEGRKMSYSKCPVAKALKEYFEEALVFPSRLDIGINKKWYSVPTPWKVVQFIYAFDRYLPIEPFEFEIEINV